MSEKVFVYGTLLEGEPNARRYLTQEKKLGPATINGFTMYSLGSFPAIVPSGETGTIIGEVWEISPETFVNLDRLEGYPNFYDRVQVETPFGTAWVYINREVDDNNRIIETGDWKTFWHSTKSAYFSRG